MLKRYHFGDNAEESASRDFYNIGIRDIRACSENREHFTFEWSHANNKGALILNRIKGIRNKDKMDAF